MNKREQESFIAYKANPFEGKQKSVISLIFIHNTKLKAIQMISIPSLTMNTISLRTRIFIAMVLLVLLTSILIVAVTVFQYREETRDYHQERLLRKEGAIKRHIDFILKGWGNQLNNKTLTNLFQEKINEIAEVHNIPMSFYDLDGELLISSEKTRSYIKAPDSCLAAEIINQLAFSSKNRFVLKNYTDNEIYQSSYSFIYNEQIEPLAILNLPYLENDDFFSKELNEFLIRLGLAYLFMIIIAVGIAYFSSNQVTKTLKTIGEIIKRTNFERRNQKIRIPNMVEEISTLVNSYNSMIDQLEISAAKLAQSEREHAWREMAKQVAHEIKNPLTPMRLTAQSFQQMFDPKDPHIKTKLNEYSNTLIQQIDTMSAMASAFSDFAKMPTARKKLINVVEVIRMSLDIFSEAFINFESEKKEIIAFIDQTQLIRVITNLVKNSIQSIKTKSDAKITLSLREEKGEVVFTVKDNGTGIDQGNQKLIFEPKFTTKSKGMGLGLPMVKNIIENNGGSIHFFSKKEKGTTFVVRFPKNTETS